MHTVFIIPMGMHLEANQVWEADLHLHAGKLVAVPGVTWSNTTPHLWAGMPFKQQPDEAKVRVHFLQYSPKPRADFLGFILDFKWLLKKKKKNGS